jgi:hypothetical protein
MKYSKTSWAEIGVKPKSVLADGRARFDTIGGPYGGYTFSLYPDTKELLFSQGIGKYVLSPPVRKNGAWVLIHEEY